MAIQRIPAHRAIQPHTKQVQEHQQAVTVDVYLCGRVMRPANRHLGDAQTMPMRQEQNLRIKTKTIDTLLFKNHAALGKAKGLEAALSIFNVEFGDHADETVEDNSGYLAKARLVNSYQRPVDGARADGNIIPRRDSSKQPLAFLDWRRKIGIGKKRQAAARLEHAAADAVTLAAVAGIGEDTKARNGASGVPYDTDSGIGGTIVNDEDFESSNGRNARGEVAADSSERSSEALFLVKRGDDDGEFGSRHRTDTLHPAGQ